MPSNFFHPKTCYGSPVSPVKFKSIILSNLKRILCMHNSMINYFKSLKKKAHASEVWAHQTQSPLRDHHLTDQQGLRSSDMADTCPQNNVTLNSKRKNDVMTLKSSGSHRADTPNTLAQISGIIQLLLQSHGCGYSAAQNSGSLVS